MARFGVNSTLANPAYLGGLFEAARGVGASAGNRRERQAQKTRAEEMNAMGNTLGMLQYQVQNARTPEEAMKAQRLLENFKDLETKRANTKADRETTAQDRTRRLGQEEAKARISILMNDRKKFEQAGNTEAVAGVDRAISSIAMKAGIEAPAIETLDPSKRYMNVGGGKVFDAKEGKHITDPTEEQKEAAGEALDPETLLKETRQFIKQGAYTDESVEDFNNYLAKNAGKAGTIYKAVELLEGVDVSKRDAEESASAVADMSRVIANIDDMLEMAPEMDPQGGFMNVVRGVGQSVGGMIAGTEAQDLENKVDSLRANTAFDRLQKMRDNSKTGGALGQVSEKELKLLQDNLASLKPNTASFRENLSIVRNAYQRAMDIEQGPEGGSPNYKTGPDGRVYYRDPVSKIVYDYETGDPVKKRG